MTIQPAYHSLEEMLDQLSGKNGEACRKLYQDYKTLFKSAPGSSHNHQAWPGGYADHITDAMNIVATLYDTLSLARALPFPKTDAMMVIYLHDLEKPFKFSFDKDGNLVDNPAIPDKAARAAKREEVMAEYGIVLNAEQANAMHYVEGIRDHEYTNERRLMGELACLCHCADVLSARMWYNHPLPAGQDEWQGSARANPTAIHMLQSEILK
jgi:23S rRNA maturation-related 3'-5' exoribonuclease YhaM